MHTTNNLHNSLINSILTVADLPLLSELPDSVSIISDPYDCGIFLHFVADKFADDLSFTLGKLQHVRRFVACARTDPFWMKPFTGINGGEIPYDTQFLLLEVTDGRFAILLPLLDSPFRTALQGIGNTELLLRAETGDRTTLGNAFCGLFIALGDDPYLLMANAARSILAKMGSGRLRSEKLLPDFLDYFGWCTWNAFYAEVSAEKVRAGLQSFVDGGVSPTLLILDDGWLSTRMRETGEVTLTSFEANTRFPGGLSEIAKMTKKDFGMRCFMVWHTLQGHWGGADADFFPQYHIRRAAHAFNQHLVDTCHWMNDKDQSKTVFNLVEPCDIARFHQDFHRYLRTQGVDGVKVDNQARMEAAADGLGGRVELMRAYHESLDASAQVYFIGRVINCMSCSTDMIYNCPNSVVTRTSDDFFPADPASHGMHIYANAMVGFFAGEFIQPDWDMFWSKHPQATLHAVARAVSGGPVYVSDEVGKHDFDLLRKLVCSDGSVLRARGVGRPTRDCLFINPLTSNNTFKVFNHNLHAGLLAIFALRHDSDLPSIAQISPRDVEGLSGDSFALYSHFSEELHQLAQTEERSISLSSMTGEIITIVPFDEDIAPFGLLDKLNSAGAIMEKGYIRNVYRINICDGGRFGACCKNPPVEVTVDGRKHDFCYHSIKKLLTLDIIENGKHVITIHW